MKTIIIILSFFGIFYNPAYSQGTIHDAVFSPDGSMIAVGGTKGVYLYRFDGMELMDTIQTPNDVQFIRWSPNMRYLIAAHWDDSNEKSLPVYSVIDLATKKNRFDILDRVRWFGRKMTYSDPYVLYPSSRYYKNQMYFYDRPSKWAYHPNSMVFSSDGNRIVAIDYQNQIHVYSVSEQKEIMLINSYKKSPLLFDYKIISLQMFSNNLLRIGDSGGQDYELEITDDLNYKLNYMNNSLYNSLFQYILWTSDRRYYFTCLAIQITIGDVSQKILLGSWESESNFILPETIPIRQRGIFTNDDKMAITINHRGRLYKSTLPEEIDIKAKNLGFTVAFTSYIVADHFDPLLLQPFSPDGEYFLLLQDENLVLYKSRTVENRILLPKQSAVSNFIEMNEN